MPHQRTDLTAEALRCVALLQRMGQRSDLEAYGLVVRAHVLRPDVMTALLELIEFRYKLDTVNAGDTDPDLVGFRALLSEVIQVQKRVTKVLLTCSGPDQRILADHYIEQVRQRLNDGPLRT